MDDLTLFSVEYRFGGGIGSSRPTDPGDYTLFYHGELSIVGDSDDEGIGSLRISRIMLGRALENGVDFFSVSDCVDQYQHDAFQAVWDFDEDHFREGVGEMFGDLILIEPLVLREGLVLRRFDINQVLDDVVGHVGGGAVAVFDEEYASFVHFNAEKCTYLAGVGYARDLSYTGLAVESRSP